MSVTRDPARNLLLQEEVHTLLQKGAVELVNPPLTPGFYSRLFLVPKKSGKMRPVIDLSVLNQHLIVPYFKMETNRSIRGSIHLGMWTTSLDLTDAYFHIPISPKFRKFLRFVWEDRVYAFKTMPFGLSTASLVFTRIFQAVVAHLHSQSIFIHSYLDDSLLKNMSQFLLRDHTHFVIGLLLKLGFLISWKKSELVPSQYFIFLGEHYRTDLGLVFPPEKKIVTLQFLVNKFFQISSVPARQFLQLIGFLISLMDVIPLGRLHIRPIQWYLREFWHPVTQMWEACIPVLPRLLPHLQWLLQRSNLLTGVPLDPPPPPPPPPPDSTLTLYTDASLTGWGAFLEGRTVSGVWEDCHIEHIHLLEMRPVLLSLRHFQEVIQRQSPLIATDNTTVVAYLQNQGGTHSFSLHLLCREIMLLCESPDSVDSETYPRQSESNSGCIISIPCSSKYGIGVTSSNFSSNHSDMGSPPDRSVCHLFELQTGDTCLSNPRPESLGSGCNYHLLERVVQLHLPTISSSPHDITQDKRGWLQDHSYSSGLAKTILVPGSPTIIVCKTASSSLERGPFVSIQGKEASSRPGETPSARMVAVRTSIRQRLF